MREPEPAADRISVCPELCRVPRAANIAWLFFWHYERVTWTLAAMVAQLLLIVLYLRVGIGRSHVPAAETRVVRVPFSLYLGCIPARLSRRR